MELLNYDEYFLAFSENAEILTEGGLNRSISINIWGRNFNLPVHFDHYSGEEILQIQKDALKAFLKSKNITNNSLEQVKQYCMKNDRSDIGEDIDNIFKYVMPREIYVDRNESKHVVAIMCRYKFDPEHGIAIVFENEKFSKVGPQDIIL